MPDYTDPQAGPDPNTEAERSRREILGLGEYAETTGDAITASGPRITRIGRHENGHEEITWTNYPASGVSWSSATSDQILADINRAGEDYRAAPRFTYTSPATEALDHAVEGLGAGLDVPRNIIEGENMPLPDYVDQDETVGAMPEDVEADERNEGTTEEAPQESLARGGWVAPSGERFTMQVPMTFNADNPDIYSTLTGRWPITASLTSRAPERGVMARPGPTNRPTTIAGAFRALDGQPDFTTPSFRENLRTFLNEADEAADENSVDEMLALRLLGILDDFEASL